MGWALRRRASWKRKPGLRSVGPPALDGLEYLCRLITPPGGPIRFNARFLLVEAGHVSGSIAGSGELEELRFYTLGEALALDLALPTRKVIERVQAWLAMTPAERMEERLMPVLRRREWRYE